MTARLPSVADLADVEKTLADWSTDAMRAEEHLIARALREAWQPVHDVIEALLVRESTEHRQRAG